MAEAPQQDDNDDSRNPGSAFDDHFERFDDTLIPSSDPARPMAPIEEPADSPNEMDTDDLLEADNAAQDVDETDDDDDSEEEDLYNAADTDPSKGRIRNSFRDVNFKNLKKKDFWDLSTGGRRLFAFVGLGGLLLSMAVGFMMFMTVYRSEHLRNLLWDYRFAKFHYQIGKRIKANLRATESLTPESTGTLEFEKTSLGQKLRGYSPEKSIKALSDGKMDLHIEKRGALGLGESKISGFTEVDAKGNKVTYMSERSGLPVPEGAKVLPHEEFSNLLNQRATAVLESAEHTKYFQRQTRKMLSEKVKIKFGDRFKGFKDKVKEFVQKENREPTAEEQEKISRTADLETATAGEKPSAGGSLESAEEAVHTDDLVNGAAPSEIPDIRAPPATETVPAKVKWKDSPTRKKLAEGSGKYSDISAIVFLVTMGCIVRDVSGSINSALTTRIDAPMRMAANLMGEAEQQKGGGDNASLDVAKIRNKEFDNSDQSAAGQRMAGTPEGEIPDSAKMSLDDFPMSFFGLSLKTVSEITAFIHGATSSPLPGFDTAVDYACGKILDPKVQLGLLVVDAIATIASLGSAEGIAQGVVQGMKTVFTVAASVGLMKIVFEYLVPKLLFSLAGAGGVLADGDPNNLNKADMGTTLLASQYGSMGGGSTVTLAQAQRDQNIAMGLVKQQKVDEMGAFAYISPSNPYSLTSQLALSLPGDPLKIPGALITKTLGLLTSKSTYGSLANVISPKVKAEGEGVYFETYGVPQTGISDEMMALDPVENAMYVDGQPGKLQELKTKYQKCFTDALSKKALAGSFDESADYSMCGDKDAQRLGLYNIDNCAGAGNLTENVGPNNCSIFDGAGDVDGNDSAQSTGATAGGTNTTGSTTAGADPNSATISSNSFTGPVPAGAAAFGSYKIPRMQYDWQNIYMVMANGKCTWTDKVPADAEKRQGLNQPGINVLNKYVDEHFGGGQNVHATCNGGEPVSKHGEGRAWDSMFNAGTPEGLQKGNELMGWLIANADAVGLQYVKFWRVEWDHQQGINCVEDAADQSSHHSHVHWELNWAGATLKTPFFKGAPFQSNPIQISQEVCPIVK